MKKRPHRKHFVLRLREVKDHMVRRTPAALLGTISILV